MKAFLGRALVSGAAVAALVSLPGVAHAGHHQWIISEIYSNADGTVQFVELKGTANNEQGVGAFSVNTFGTTTSAAALAPNIPDTLTAGRYLLVATAGYATLATQQGAPAPDRVLPNNFLELGGDTVRYAGILATDRIYTSGQLPTNGINALDYETGVVVTKVNSPQNSFGAVGTINAAPLASVPAAPRWALILLVGCLVGGAGLVLRRRAQPSA